MYFAVSRTNPAALRSALNDTLDVASTRTRCFALIDTAFDHGAKPAEWWDAPLPVYCSDKFEPLASVGPQLLTLSRHKASDMADQVDRLITHCDGRPMLVSDK